MKRILILANNDVGLYKFRKDLIQTLINQGNEVYISLPYGELVIPLKEMGCKFIDTPIDRRGINPIKDIKLVLNYFKIFNQIKPLLIITYTIKPNIYGGILSVIKRIPYVLNITGMGTAFQKEGLFKKLIVILYRLACLRAKVVFFENIENQRIFIENKIISRDRTFKVNGAGVDLDEYQYINYPPEKHLNFLFIGRVMKEKGVDELFNVAKKLKEEFPNISFDIVGPLEDDYKEIILNLERHDIINFHGFQKDVKPFIEKSHCFILPSYHEGMANTLLECGAMGRPLITSNIYGCKEAVIDGKSGLLVNVSDSHDLYVKVKKFIQLPYQEKLEMAKKSREHIEKCFDKSKVIETTVKELRLDEPSNC